MRGLIVLSALVACALAAPGYLHGGYASAPTVYNSVGYSGHPLAYSAPAITYAAPAIAYAASSQHVAQNTLGQYNYGYTDGHSAKSESRGIDGSVAGAYSYVDGKGEVQKVEYTADSNGFHVAASNLPVGPVAPESAPLVAPEPVQDTPEVVEARAQFLTKFEEVKNRKVEVAAPVVAPVVAAPVAYNAPLTYSSPIAYNAPIAYSAPAVSGYSYAAPAVSSYSYAAPAISSYSYAAPAVSSYSYAAPAYTSYNAVKGYAYAAPHTYAYSAPAVSYAAVAPVSSQYHAQDELGQYSYGYNGGLSAKSESKTFDGVTRGGYSYVDANGLVQKVDYTADAVHGFRVAATNLPVGPVADAAVAVPDTPEVVAAKAVHFAAHVEAKERLSKAL